MMLWKCRGDLPYESIPAPDGTLIKLIRHATHSVITRAPLHNWYQKMGAKKNPEPFGSGFGSSVTLCTLAKKLQQLFCISQG